MEGLLNGDDDAIRALYARFGRPVFSLGMRLLGSREAAEELAQDVFLTAWRKAARFDPARGRLSTWLMTIAHNLAVDRLRRETGARRPTLVLVDEVPDAPERERGGRRRGARRGDPGARVADGGGATVADPRVLPRADRPRDRRGRRDPARDREDAAPHGDDQGAARERRQGAPVNCLSVRERLTEQVLGVLPKAEGADVDRHLEWCAACRKEAGELQRAAATLAYSVAPVEPPAELEERVVEAVRGAAGRRRATAPRRSRVAAAGVLAAMLALSGLGWGAVMAGRAERAEQQAADAAERAAGGGAQDRRGVPDSPRWTPRRSLRSRRCFRPRLRRGRGDAFVLLSPSGDDLVFVLVDGLTDVRAGPVPAPGATREQRCRVSSSWERSGRSTNRAAAASSRRSTRI